MEQRSKYRAGPFMALAGICLLMSGCGEGNLSLPSLGKSSKTDAVPAAAIEAAVASAKAVDSADVVSTASTKSVSAQAQADLTEDASRVVRALSARDSVLIENTAFDTVARSVMARSGRASEAELMSARLRADAANKNWLPRIGPNVSLSSLGDLVASLVVEMVIFDNGKKKAERRFAAADVEVAAVNLAQDANTRVYTALGLYVAGLTAAHEARVSSEAHSRLKQFEQMIQLRVNGGVSDMSDLQVISAKLREAAAERDTSREAADTAFAELDAMSSVPLGSLRKMSDLDAMPMGLTPLPVLKAEAVKTRDVAQAVMDRADMLPGLKISASVSKSSTDAALVAAGEQLLGLGTGASLGAIEATQEAAARRVIQEKEDSDRLVARLQVKNRSLNSQMSKSTTLIRDARDTFNLFQDQFQTGGRSIMDVVNAYENLKRIERDAVRLPYERSLIQLELASHLGALVDGGAI